MYYLAFALFLEARNQLVVGEECPTISQSERVVYQLQEQTL